MHKFHRLTERQFQAFENARHHAAAHIIVVVKSPALSVVPVFGGWFADVVQQCRPTQPEVVAFGGEIVEYFERMQKIVFVCATVAFFDAFHCRQFGENERKKSCLVEQKKAYRWAWSCHYLVQFVDDALLRDDGDAAGVAFDGIECFGCDAKIKLRGEAYGAHHTQWVVAECDVGVAGRAQNFCLHIGQTAKWVEQFAETHFVQADSQRIHREIAAILVVFERAVLHYRVARFAAVRFAACAHKLQLVTAAFDLRRAVGSEHRHMCAAAQFACHRLRHIDAAAHHHHIDIFRWAMQNEVAHIAANHIAFETEFVGHAANKREYRASQFHHFAVRNNRCKDTKLV